MAVIAPYQYILVLAVALTTVLPDPRFQHLNEGHMTKAKVKPPQTEPVRVDLIRQAIADGSGLIAQGKSKADAAIAIFRLIGECGQEVVVQAFVEGAALTPKGALTYWYNCKRKLARERKKTD